MSFELATICVLEVHDDWPLVGALLSWFAYGEDSPLTLRGGSSGRGNLIEYFPESEKDQIASFIAQFNADRNQEQA